MNRRTAWQLAIALAANPLILTACEQPRQNTAVRQDEVSVITANIESVDRTARAILLSGPQGGLVTIHAGPDIRNFDQLKAGQRVKIMFREAWAAEIVPPGTPGGAPSAAMAAARAPQGAMPAGAVGAQLKTRVTIQSVDPANSRVTFLRPDGKVRTVTARRAVGQQFVSTLRPGDQVEVTYTEAVAVSVEPAN